MPKTEKKKFDLDAAIAEATGAPFEFTYRGEDWSLPPMESLPAQDVVVALAGGEIDLAVKAFELAFGDRWADFFDGSLPLAGLTRLAREYMAHSGMTQGESEASTS